MDDASEPAPSAATADRADRADEIHTARVFPVPRRTLYGAFADPAVLAAWWGPHGSVTVFERFDLRPGGEWRFVMHAPDGTAYAMANDVEAVDPPALVVLRHEQAGHGFRLHMHYDAVDAGRTRLRWRMRFDSAAEAARVRAFVAEANEQNFDRLEAALGLPPGRGAPPTGERVGGAALTPARRAAGPPTTGSPR